MISSVSLFFYQVFEEHFTDFDVVTGGVRSADVGGEFVNLHIVLLCVLLQHCEVEFTFVPHLIERVFQQVVLVENSVE